VLSNNILNKGVRVKAERVTHAIIQKPKLIEGMNSDSRMSEIEEGQIVEGGENVLDEEAPVL
jgi:hypothetical protein